MTPGEPQVYVAYAKPLNDDQNIGWPLSRRVRAEDPTLEQRRPEIEQAIALAGQILQSSAAKLPSTKAWEVTELEAKFGLTFGMEAGVIISKASVEAALEVTIKIARTGHPEGEH